MVSLKNASGFTLVELAVVMIVIGLLIGGVLKGQELVSNSKLSATISQIKGIEGAVLTFSEAYNALPGDITNPTVVLKNCAAAPCNRAGDASGTIDASSPMIGSATVVGFESHTVWSHLAAADLINGVDPTSDAAVFGEGMPSAPVGGGFSLAYGTVGRGAIGGAMWGSGHHYIGLFSSPQPALPRIGPLTAGQAARIDRKMDDGNPATGIIRGHSAAGTCMSARAPYQWTEDETDVSGCGISYRIAE